MTWFYKGSEFTTADIGDNIGCVYLITDKVTQKKYVGKKIFFSTRKLPPLKGKTRRRTKVVESDWKTYYGSNDEIKLLIEQSGEERFYREILHLCKSKGVMSYLELVEQVKREVLLRPDEFYNGIIQVKIHRTHVRSLINNDEEDDDELD